MENSGFECRHFDCRACAPNHSEWVHLRKVPSTVRSQKLAVSSHSRGSVSLSQWMGECVVNEQLRRQVNKYCLKGEANSWEENPSSNGWPGGWGVGSCKVDGGGKCPIHQIYQVCGHQCPEPAHPVSMVGPGIELQKTAFAILLFHPSSLQAT